MNLRFFGENHKNLLTFTSDEKCGIIPKEFYKGVIDKL